MSNAPREPLRDTEFILRQNSPLSSLGNARKSC